MRYDQISPVPPLTRVTKILIITCVSLFFVEFMSRALGWEFNGLDLTQIFGLVPSAVAHDKWYWQFFTYIFFHGHAYHLLLNMLILWYFGAEIELKMGEKEFTLFFLLCGIGAGLFNYAVNMSLVNPLELTTPIIGASGAIYGLLAAYGIFFGNRYFLVLFLFPMKAKYFVLVIAALELYTGVESSPKDNVAHFCHLGGMAIGALYVYFRYVRPIGGTRTSRKDAEREKLKRQFTLIVNENNDAKKKDDEKGPYWN